MVTWMMSQQQMYFYRLYDTKTDKWTEVKPLINGPIRPWPTMYNKILARGTDFYWVGLSGDRYVRLFKYNAKTDVGPRSPTLRTPGPTGVPPRTATKAS